MSAAALLLATLIGVFITPDGIVVGSDTALSNVSGQVASQQKYCVTGPRSVATLQGSYVLQDTETKATTELYARFRELCAEFSGRTAQMPLRQQADYIANALRADLVSFLERLPAAEVVRAYGSSPVVARIAVTGYTDAGPESIVVGLGLAIGAGASKWEAQVRPLTRLTFTVCGVRFHGQESVMTALTTDTGVRIAPSELQQPDVARLSALLKGNCAQASVRSAPSMFVQAVRLTATLGPGFGVPNGSVSAPIDLVVIPRDGAIDVTRIPSW
jgi:hypothetical protein